MIRRLILLSAFILIAIYGYCNEIKSALGDKSVEKNKQVFSVVSNNNEKIEAILFYSAHCKVCLEMKKDFFPKVEDEYKDRVKWQYLDIIKNEANLTKLITISAKVRGKTAFVPAVFVGGTLLMGREEITGKLRDAIELSLKERKSYFGFIKSDILQIFKKISVFTVITSGLIDGINPCAFAVIVFFVSFLAVYGYRKREIIYVGSFYCLAVFLTYLLIGLGFFNFLYSLANFYTAIKIFYYFIAAFCFILSGLALYDYFKFKRTKETDGLILQLPPFLKKRINDVIGSHLRNKKDESVISLSISAFVVGFLVSLLEAVCTGQVYLPTIVLILKNTTLRLKAFSYLILYNLMFILPLVVVFMFSFLGFGSQKFNKLLKDNILVIKFLMFLLFLLLGGVILWIS